MRRFVPLSALSTAVLAALLVAGCGHGDGAFVAGIAADSTGQPTTRTRPLTERKSLQAALKQHCVRCHGDKKTEAEINFVKAFASKPHGIGSDLNLLEKMIKALSSREMPPEDQKQPSEAQRQRWIAELKAILKTRLETQPGFARVPMRRMNRVEYNNAVKDLFQLSRDPFALPERTVRDIGGYFKPASGKMPNVLVVGNRAMGKSQFIGTGNTLPGVAAFPKDNRAEHGFNNRGDHLSLSPVLLESFFALSQSILNSREFPTRAGNWKTLFVAPAGLSGDKLKDEGKRRLKAFLRRAFRRDVPERVVALYQKRFLHKLSAGETFTSSMKATIAAALVSPRFLYVYAGSGDNQSKTQSLDEFELASRLSFFLWRSIPDDTLLDLAAQKKLSDPKVLSAQVDRMLNDPRIKNFCDSFALQWLKLDQMVAAVPDNKRFRPYYFGGATKMVYMVGMHMMLEPLLVFETVLIENRPIMELIDSDFTYRSEMLNRWYGRDKRRGRMEVIGIRFRRMPLKDRRWGGVITNAAVMTMTSSPLRTKPITRGAWLVSTIFNDPPKPPPPNVPKIEESDDKLRKQGLTLRNQLKAHVTDPNCAGCHKKIDPLGFALENYDPVGRWRDKYRTDLPVDSSGKLFNRHAFKGIVGFKDAILAEKPRFARAFSGHLLSYALGRKLDARDGPSLDGIVANSRKGPLPVPDDDQTGRPQPGFHKLHHHKVHRREESEMSNLSRRSFLRGAGGTAMALPWLNLMHAEGRGSAVKQAPTRMAFYYIPIGVVRRSFFPADSETQYRLTPTLKPLAKVKHKTNLITGLDRITQSGTDVHAQCGSCFLTSAAPNEVKGSAYPLSRTLDHVIADHVGDATPFRTLELSCNSHKDNKESIYFDNISWYRTGHVAPSLRDPRKVYRRLFGTKHLKEYRDITDLVLEDAHSFRKELGAEDRRKFSEYFDSVRALEKQIDRVEQKKDLIAKAEMIEPKDVALPRREYIRLMGDLMIVALQNNLTRVATLMIGPERWNTPTMYEGVFDKPRSHHQLSHAQNRERVKRDLEKIDHFHVNQFAYLIQKMDSIKEGDRSLLDNTVFTLGSGLGDGQTHQYNKLPIITAGSGGGRFKTGRLIKCPNGTPLANLWLSYARLMGLQRKRFADSTGPLKELGVSVTE